MIAGESGLTREQWAGVEAALPKIRKLAERLARRLAGTRLGVDEIDTMLQDLFMARAHRWDPSRGSTLYDFAHREVELDLIRAASKRHGVEKCVQNMERTQETIVETPLATLWAESPEEAEARAVALGQEHALAGRFGYHAAANGPEDAYARREEAEVMKRAASGTEPRVAQLLGLLYEQDLTWDQASAEVGLDKRKAQRLIAQAFGRLRVIFGDRVRAAPP